MRCTYTPLEYSPELLIPLMTWLIYLRWNGYYANYLEYPTSPPLLLTKQSTVELQWLEKGFEP